MLHRIRAAVQSETTVEFGANAIEVDETFTGHKHKKAEGASPDTHKDAMRTQLDRNSGKSKSFAVKKAKAATLLPILRVNIAHEAEKESYKKQTHELIGPRDNWG
jgi:hypothetical protein